MAGNDNDRFAQFLDKYTEDLQEVAFARLNARHARSTTLIDPFFGLAKFDVINLKKRHPLSSF